MTAYSKRFRRLHPRVIALTTDLVRSRPWSKPEGEQLEAARVWVAQVSRVYGIEVPTVRFGPCGGSLGFYRPMDHAIVLERFSLTTLLHEYRHAMQHRSMVRVSEDLEVDARAWSLSLFRRAAPRRFERMVAADRILFEAESR